MILDHIDKYYDDNYNTCDVSIQKDYVHNKVWSIHFDEMQDLVYIVMAKIDITKGDTQFTVNDFVKINKVGNNPWSALAKKTQTENIEYNF